MSSSDLHPPPTLRDETTHWTVRFTAMACPCEVLIRTKSSADAQHLASLAYQEALRIERKFSRYRDDNIVHAINHANGRGVKIDAETYQLLKYAGDCNDLSGGLFDVTSGILRRAWEFKGEEFRPDPNRIAFLLDRVGWEKIQLEEHKVTLYPGMEIDFGGIGKEYAVDKVAQRLLEAADVPVMVNFGGDIRIPVADPSGELWYVGLGDADRPEEAVGLIKLREGAVTTSGLAYRYCLVGGKRLGHILNPRTGWPAEEAPRSVTVIAGFCLEAGMLSTLAMLHGRHAETFLADQQVTYYCSW